MHLLDRHAPDRIDTRPLDSATAAEVDHLAGRYERWCEPRGDRAPAVTARALAATGRCAEARAVLTEAMPTQDWSMSAIAAGVWTVSRIGRPDEIAALTSAVERAAGADRFLSDGALPLGPVAMYRGVLAAASGDLDVAVRLLRQAVEEGDERAPAWGAMARLELVRVLYDLEVDAPGSHADYLDRVRASAKLFYVAAGFDHQAAALDEIGGEAMDDLARPGVGCLRPGPRWLVGFGVEPPVELAATKGLHALRYLIANRSRPVPAVELDHAVNTDARTSKAAVVAMIADADVNVLSMLSDEQVRTRTSKLVRRTIARISDVHPRLARHLEGTITTGHRCMYDGGARARWRLS